MIRDLGVNIPDVNVFETMCSKSEIKIGSVLGMFEF